MTCETTRHELLALPDPRRLPAELHAHVAGCPECAGFRRGLAALHRLVPRIPVPPASPKVKADFLAHVAASGVPAGDWPPIIARRPRPSDSGTAFTALWASREQWQYAAGVAATLVIGLSVWWLATGPRTGAPETAKLRHELLGREVKHLAALTKAETASQRVAVWSDLAADLHGEAKYVYVAAQADEMRSLERMYARAVQEGLLKQAALLPATYSPAERQAALADADAKLRAAEAEAGALAKEAPPRSQPTLLKMAGTARVARARIQAIIRGEA